MHLEKIFALYNIRLKDGEYYRNVIDVLEDLYLRISPNDYKTIVEKIASTESIEGFIFDEARNRPYK